MHPMFKADPWDFSPLFPILFFNMKTANANSHKTAIIRLTGTLPRSLGIVLVIALILTIAVLASEGDYLWAKRLGGTGGDIGTGIAVDGSGNVYTTGYFEATADFDPGAGTAELTSAGSLDIFVSKLEGSATAAAGGGEDEGGEGRNFVVGASGETFSFSPLPPSYGPTGYVCGETPGFSLFGLGGLQLPDTGFAPGVVTDLAAVEEQPAGKEYFDLADFIANGACGVKQSPTSRGDCFVAQNAPRNDISERGDDNFVLEIPTLGLELPIVGVPLTGHGWDVSWLDDAAGYLEGTAYPTWVGNTAITAHVWDRDNNPGPFVNLYTLQHGDQVIIHAWWLRHIYEVRDLMQVRPDTLKALPHSEYDMLTLITCQGFDESSGEYGWRLAVQAVLMKVKAE